MATFVILKGKQAGRELVVPDGDILVGRDEACLIRLNSSRISRRHCRLRVNGDSVSAKDLGSRNGTQINDVSIEDDVQLQPNDVITIGPLQLRVAGGQRSVALGSSPEVDSIPHNATDHDVAAWLSDPPESDPTMDTAIMSLDTATATIPPPLKDNFSSVSEEAADIIRRWMSYSASQSS